MRTVTATEKYRAVLEGTMAKREFVRQMRQQYPSMVSQYDGFDSTVQILKNRQMIFEAQKPAFSGAKVYDDRPALTYSLDSLDRGIRAELAAAGITMPHQGVKPEDYLKAEKKAKDNLEKNPTHYLDLMSGESNKVDKHDKQKEVKRGAADKDTFNDMKKAALKEEVEEVAYEMGEDAKKNLLGQVVSALRSKYPDITAGILKDFIRTHGQDLLDGADIEDEFAEYISVNYDSLSEKQGKDHDGDGDIDGDDYMAAKDKAIKKAMGKDESYAMKRMQKAHTQDRLAGKKSTYDKAKEKDGKKEKQLKEAIKSIIKKTLTEEVINEAATAKLADWGAAYESFEGVKSVVNELENIVTEVEQFYDKIGDKIAKTFAKTADFRNEEGLKIGAFIAPSLETAFNQDLRPVIKKGFTKKVELPKVKTISQADIAAARERGEIDETEVLEEPKSTVFTPNF